MPAVVVGTDASVEWTEHGLRVLGDLDQHTVVALRRAVESELDARLAGAGSVAVDLAGVVRADSAALSLVLHWMRRARAHGGTIVLRNLPDQMRALVHASRMERYVTDGTED